ncbi:MAG: putative toxin-antitoxin system toxin component, PIN family [Candidatus Aminicenantes bacterium]|nr:MAG: putative toxin-antitoxin system toxin component, PIN family [Candidatus Aminicenantes bacterium]RPJ03456.1 MAG: putative toxin-antitoxin system toxin component, PIN family [Candidatus Aminicenantes bacterium]
MRIFLDTNVIVAAVATRGLCADVVRDVLARCQLIVSVALFEEVTTVLTEKMRVPAAHVFDLTALLREGAVLSNPSSDAEEIPIRDQADKVLISAALAGKAELFVTGDVELLELREIGPMAVVSPRGFWELVKAVPKS